MVSVIRPMSRRGVVVGVLALAMLLPGSPQAAAQSAPTADAGRVGYVRSRRHHPGCQCGGRPGGYQPSDADRQRRAVQIEQRASRPELDDRCH